MHFCCVIYGIPLFITILRHFCSCLEFRRVLCRSHDNHASIICFTGDKLLSANTFACLDPHDTTYYIASIWEKLEFSQTTDRLCLSGEVDAQKAVTDILKKLIRRVEYMPLQPKVLLTEVQKKTLPTDILATLCV